MAQQRHTWRRRGVKAAAVTAGVIVALTFAGKYALAPALLRWQVDRRLPEYWDGSAEIEGIDFDYTGLVPITLRGVALRDAAGRCWFRAESVRLVLAEFPSLHPRLGAVILTRPTVTAHCRQGRCRPPLRRLPSEWWDEYVDLKALEIECGSIEVTEDGKLSGRSAPLDVSLRDAGGTYSLAVGAWRLRVTGLRAEAFGVRNDGIEIRRLGGWVCGGRIAGSLIGRLTPDGTIETRGHVAGRDVNLAAMRLPVRGAERGLVTGIFHFDFPSPDARAPAGRGVLFVTGADLSNVPAVAEVLRRAGLGRLDVMRQSDVEAHFDLRGTVVDLRRTRLELSLAAVDVEPGATVDLWTGQIDAVAVAVLFEKVRDLLRSIPLVSLVVDVTERLSRFHIEGAWSEPESLVVTPAPLRGIQRASKKFLTAAARDGGAVGQGVLRHLRDAFDSNDANAPATRAVRPGR